MSSTRFTTPLRIACLVAMTLGVMTLGAPSALAGPGDRVGLCHATGKADRPYIYIEVNQTGISQHLAHGDYAAPNGESDCSPLPPNANPNAVDDTATTPENTPVAIAVLANDTDAEGNPLTITALDATTAAGGSAAVNANGTVSYAPPANFAGEDLFTYTISDGYSGTDTATVTVTVEAVNHPPDATSDFASDHVFTDLGTFQHIPVLANDTDVDSDPLTLVGIAVPPTVGEVFIHDDGTISYAWVDHCTAGEDTFTYTVTDGQGGTDSAEVAITMYNGGTPTVISGTYATAENTPLTVPVVDWDSEYDYAWVMELIITGGTAPGDITFDGKDSLTYTPEPGFVGRAEFTFEVANHYGCTGSGSLTIDVG